MQNYNPKFKKGFTLIELLVVVALIGVLATLVLANLNAARQRGRDAQRKSDLRNIQTALRLYYNDYDKYPAGTGKINGCGTGGASLCIWGDPFEADGNTYMSTLPTDSLPDIDYRYTQDPLDIDSYTLEACLENKSDEKCSEEDGGTWCPSTSGCVYVVKP
jgi:prepilin-type N-terminal cleavage/methylation domain-containing protein